MSADIVGGGTFGWVCSHAVDDEFREGSGERGEVDVSEVVGSKGVPRFVVGWDDDVGCCFEDEETETV